jgi:hypothetical protein
MRKTRNIKRKLLKKRHTRKNRRSSRKVKLIEKKVGAGSTEGKWNIGFDPNQNPPKPYCYNNDTQKWFFPNESPNDKRCDLQYSTKNYEHLIDYQ